MKTQLMFPLLIVGLLLSIKADTMRPDNKAEVVFGIAFRILSGVSLATAGIGFLVELTK